jgi:hypothetical protein
MTMKACRMSHEFEMSADALRSLRQLAPNEKVHMRRALDTIQQTPVGQSADYQFLSQNKKHSTYRFRTVVGFVVYFVPLEENSGQRLLITQILPFKKKAASK